MLVTLIADASFCQHYKVAACGYWVASGRGFKLGSTQVTRPIMTPREAEIFAVCRACVVAATEGVLRCRDTLVVYSDCKGALGVLMGQISPSTEFETSLVNGFERVCRSLRINATGIYIKGHSQRKSGRYLMQNLCDAMARDLMRDARRLVQRRR